MQKQDAKQSLKWIFLRIRPIFRLIKGFRGSARAIAGGFSLGLFLGLTPTVGVQLIIAVFLATLFKVSRPAALVAVMVTNPVTVPPIFTFNYWVGSLFLDGPSVGEVYSHFIKITAQMAKMNVWEVCAQITAFAETGQEMLVPLILGSLIVATVASCSSYYLLLGLLNFLEGHRGRRKKKQDTAPD